MNQILNWKEFLLQEENKKVYVFDFDDTIAETNDLIGILRLIDGKPVKSMSQELINMGIQEEDIKKITPSKKYKGSGIAWITTKGYKDYMNAVKKTADSEIEKNGSELKGVITLVYDRVSDVDDENDDDDENDNMSGITDMLDFTTSAHIDLDTKPVPSMIKLAKNVNKNPDITVGVVTARKGTTDMTSIDGQTIKATNKEDIVKWLKKHGIKIDSTNVYGAADFGKKDFPKIKADIVDKKFIERIKPDSIHFFDDDPRNGKAVSEIPDSESDIYVYTGDFAKGDIPNKPIFVKGKNKE